MNKNIFPKIKSPHLKSISDKYVYIFIHTKERLQNSSTYTLKDKMLAYVSVLNSEPVTNWNTGNVIKVINFFYKEKQSHVKAICFLLWQVR